MKNKLFQIGKPMLSIAVAIAILAVSLLGPVPGIELSATAATVVTDALEDTHSSESEEGGDDVAGDQPVSVDDVEQMSVTESTTETGEIDLLEFGDYLVSEFGSASTQYDTNVADNGETGADWDNAIIIDSAEEFVYLCKASGNETAGKYYKVADGIVGFNLSTEGLELGGTLADNLDVIINSGKDHTSNANAAFQGYFDGNGVTVYGAYAYGNYVGLFCETTGTVTIKNLNVKLGYFSGGTAAGGIIGHYQGSGTGTLTIENCSVIDCYIESRHTGTYGAGIGAIYGFAQNYNGSLSQNGPIYITNCFINLDEEYFISKDEESGYNAPATNGIVHGGLGGYAVTNRGMVKDCVVIGINPYSTYKTTGDNQHQHTNDPNRFTNVYTDAPSGVVTVGGIIETRNFTNRIFQLTPDQMKGLAAKENMDLNWSVWMLDDEGYPELRISHKNISAVDNGDGTHTEECSCGFGNVTAVHDWSNKTGFCAACNVTCGLDHTGDIPLHFETTIPSTCLEIAKGFVCCDKCGYSVTGDLPVSAEQYLDIPGAENANLTNHTGSNGVCQWCNKNYLGYCTWTLDGTMLTISGNGPMADMWYNSVAPWGTNITEVVIEDGVTHIGNYAFNKCTGLTSITIPDSVTSIGNYAFSNCTSLTSVTIPDSVTSIGDYAFNMCTSLTSVTIPDSVTSIGNYAFNNCDSLTSITIPDSVTSIGNYAFNSCDSLTSIIIPDSVTSMGNNAFSYCDSLTSITIPDSVTSIGNYAFSNCTSLTSITIPDSVTSIGNGAFGDCTSLTSITIPDSVTSIGEYAFSYCTGLTNVNIGVGITTINRGVFMDCTGLTSVIISDSVTIIDESAFAGCLNITSVTIPKNVTYIGIGAFGNTNIKEVHFSGTIDDWYAITICELNQSLTAAQRYYICETEGHKMVPSEVTEPTCSNGGYTMFTCLSCGESYLGDITAPTGHVSDNWEIIKNPTCSKPGSKKGVCKDCGIEITVEIPTTEHAYDAWRYEVVPTCSENGKIICTCLLCSQQKQVTVDAYGHEFSAEWTIDREPTCTAVGSKSHHCTRPGCTATSDVTEIAPKAHSYSDVITKPTCTTDGYTEHICTVCAYTYITDVIAASGHTLTHYDAVASTCENVGHPEYDVCSVCDYTTYEEIEAIGHDYQLQGENYVCSYCGKSLAANTTHNYIKTIVKPTETTKGYTQYTCTDCGYYYRADETEILSGAKFSVSDAVVGAGKKVVLTVSIAENPGIETFKFNVNYDTDSITLVEIVDSGKLGGTMSFGNDIILWYSGTGDTYYNGAVFQLVFEVSAYAEAQDYAVSLSYTDGDIVNSSLSDVDFGIEDGVVTVEEFTAGDLNDDGKVNMKDLVLMSDLFARKFHVKHKGKNYELHELKGPYKPVDKGGINVHKDYSFIVRGIEIDRASLDVNNDGVINPKDMLTLMNYLLGEPVEIK